jgi:flagellar biosynthesis protein FlhA
VLQRLLAEEVSIRDLPTILEVLADVAAATKDPATLTEHVRSALPDAVCRPYLAPDGQLHVLRLGADTERALLEALRGPEGEVGLPPDLVRPLVEAVGRTLEAARPPEARPVLLVPGPLRRHLRRGLEASLPHLGVLAWNELPARARLRALGVVELAHAPQTV